MKTFPACAVLLVSLVGAGALFASGQVIGQPTSTDNRAEEEVRRLNADEVDFPSQGRENHGAIVVG